MIATKEFKANAPKLMFDLQRAFALSRDDAAAIAGNTGHESGGFAQMLQGGYSPNTFEGGLNICQWSGSRNRLFRNFCAANHIGIFDVEAGARFLVKELSSTQAFVLPHVKAARTLYDKVAAFEQQFERAGKPAISSRYMWAVVARNLPPVNKGFIYG